MAQTATAEPQQNKMGVMPVGKLLISMGLPMVLSMLVQALYNIVDSVFVAQINEASLTAVSMAFPVQNFMIAAVSGMGVGVNSLLSRSLGEGNVEEANRAANNGIFLAFLTMIVFVIFGIFGSRPFFAIQTNDPEIIAAGATYVQVCCIGSFGCFGQIIFERLLQATGQAHLSMITQMTGAITNIILDPIMIFGLLGCPKMGVAGAALATVIGQVLACVLGLIMNIKLNTTLTISPKYRPNGRVIAEIYRVGVPSIAMQSVGSVMNMAMNMILMGFTSTATAVFGVYYKLQSFAIMPVIGLSNAMIPIIAFNYGARKRSRISQTIKYSIISAEIFPDYCYDGIRFPAAAAAADLQRFRQHAGDGHSGSADNGSELPDLRYLHLLRFGLPGTGQWRIQSGCLGHASAGRTDPGSMADVADRQP